MKNLECFLKLSAMLLLLSAGIFAQSKNLAGKRWILSEIGGAKTGATKAFLEFDADQKRVTGNAGCNNLFASIAVSQTKLKFSGIGTTKMFCQQGKPALLEKNFLNSLERTTNYKKSGDTLTLYAGKKAVLKFQISAENISEMTETMKKNMISPAAQNNSFNIVDKKWMFSLSGGERSDTAESFAFIVFSRDSKNANGDSGCSGFGGEYSIDGDKIIFNQTMMTDRMCQDESRRNSSSVFMNGLGTANRFSIVGGNLNLYHDDELLLTLKSGGE